MFKKLVLTSAMFASASVFAQAHANVMDPKVEIQQSLSNFADVWNKTHDAKQMSEFWTTDGDLINPFGVWGNSRDGVMKVFEMEQTGPLKESAQKFEVEKVRSLSAELAFVDAKSFMTVREGKKKKDMFHHVALLMSKKDEKWLIVAARPYLFAPSMPSKGHKKH